MKKLSRILVLPAMATLLIVLETKNAMGVQIYDTQEIVGNQVGRENLSDASQLLNSDLGYHPAADKSRPRVVVSTDFPPLGVIPGGAGFGEDEFRSDPDDVQSMIRFLLYTNELKVEGLIASAATVANYASTRGIDDLITLYDQIDENLQGHDPAYPSADVLRALTWLGQSGSYARPASEIIGPGKDSEASEAIIRLLDDKSDPNPVWFLFWGGSRELAQAIWKVRETREKKDLDAFLSKIRVYLIAAQDGTGQWLMEEFPDLFVIYSEANWKGMFYNSPGSDESLANLAWLNRHMRWGNGMLAAFYPETGWFTDWQGVVEGDSPSFLHLVSGLRGINNPEDPSQAGWGGQFIRKHPAKNHWIDHPDGQKTVWKWRADFQEDFARKVKWMRHPVQK